MNRGQVITLVANRLGRRTDLNTELLTEGDLMQETKLERNGRIIPWFLETERESLVTVANQDYVSLPADFLSEKEERLFEVQSPDSGLWLPMTKGDMSNLAQKFVGETGIPTRYSISATRFFLFPTPDAVYPLRTIYYAKDTLFSAIADDNTDNLWLRYASDLFVAALTQQCAAQLLHDFELAATLEGAVNGSWERVRIETQRREHENREYHSGDAP